MERNLSISHNVMKYALFLGLASIAFTFVTQITNLALIKGVGYLMWAILIIGVVLGVKNYRDAVLGGNISFGIAFKFGFLQLFLAGVLNSAFNYVYLTVLDKGYLQDLKDFTVQELVKSGVADAQLDSMISSLDVLMTPGYIILMTFVSSVIGAAILGLIIGAIMKKEVITEN